MRTLKKNKRNMKYSLFINKVKDFEYDDDGNIKTRIVDGQVEYLRTGTYVSNYSEPIPFKANISSTLNKLQAESWGVSQSNIYAEINCKKGYLPLQIGSKVWRENEVRYKGDRVDESSADYTVMGLMTEGISEDYYLLQRNDVEK